MATIAIKIKGGNTIPFENIKEFQGELKTHNQEKIENLKKSILEEGFIAPIVIWDGKDFILDGHQRQKALKGLLEDGHELEGGEVPVIKIIAETLADAKKILLKYNTEYTDGFNMLELKEFAGGLDLTYLESPTLDILRMNIHQDELNAEKEDEVPYDEIDAQELAGQIIVKHGDIFELGDHRLMCGNSGSLENINKLMDGEKAHMVFTDPPYGVSYTGTNNPNGRPWDIIKGDHLRGTELYDMLEASFKSIAEFTIEKPAIYICYASKSHIEFETAILNAKLQVRQQLIWAKHMVLGHSAYHWAHEPILFVSKEMTAEWYGDRTWTTLIHNCTEKDIEKMKKEDLVEALKEVKRDTTVFRIGKDNAQDYIHPTQKPVELPQKCILNSSKPGDIVFEPFAGSGSTLIACEKNQRKCRAIDLDPKYVQLILKRYFQYTGKTPKCLTRELDLTLIL